MGRGRVARWGAGLVAAGLLASLLSGVASAGSSYPDGTTGSSARPVDGKKLREIRIVDYNISKSGFGAGFGDPRRPGRALDWALAVATRDGAEAIMLQEVCDDQLTELRRRHPRWTIASTRIAIAYNRECGGGWQSDVVIWTRSPFGRVSSRYVDPRPGGQPATGGTALTCIAASLYVTPVHFCVTHLPARADRESPARAVWSLTRPMITAGHLVVLGGDFNHSPEKPALGYVYQQGRGPGMFMEAGQLGRGSYCRCGAPTARTTGDHGRKIDYVFASANRVGPQTARSLTVVPRPTGANPAAYSDHHLLRARLSVWFDH